MRAVKPFTYARKPLAVGDTFTARKRDGQVLGILGKAEEASAPAPAPAPKPAAKPKPASGRKASVKQITAKDD